MNGESNNEGQGQNGLPLKAQVECLLFVANEPVLIERMASVLAAAVDEVEHALSSLAQEYVQRGIRLQQKARRVQLVTAPEAADLVRTFLGLELTSRLSPAALETLAIVAYRQPVTRAEIEAVRGVSTDSVLRTLLHRGLVEEQGRLEQVGRPIIYGTTFEFLQQFGLTSLEELPPLLTEEGADASTPIQIQSGHRSEG